MQKIELTHRDLHVIRLALEITLMNFESFDFITPEGNQYTETDKADLRFMLKCNHDKFYNALINDNVKC